MTEAHTAEPRVYFVGAGPGAADLLTLRAVRVLARAEFVLHDALVDEAVLALASQARLIPVGKRAHSPSTAQRFINKTLVDCATQSIVCRAAEGRRPVDLRPTRRRDAGAACRWDLV